jgi:hypothetical protein
MNKESFFDNFLRISCIVGVLQLTGCQTVQEKTVGIYSSALRDFTTMPYIYPKDTDNELVAVCQKDDKGTINYNMVELLFIRRSLAKINYPNPNGEEDELIREYNKIFCGREVKPLY